MTLRIEHLDRAPDGFLAHEVEDAQFHRAFQAAQVPGFSDVGYYALYRGEQRVSVVPYFLMRFCANTMLPEGLLKRSLAWLSYNVACIGHPTTDLSYIDGEASAEVLEAVNRELSCRASTIVYKGFRDELPLKGFVKAKGLATAILPLHPDYWSKLASKRRYNLRQKLRQGDALRVEEVDALTDEQARRIHALYMKTYDHAVIKAECLNLEYFLAIAPFTTYVLYFEGDDVIGFISISAKDGRAVARHCGIDYERANKYGMYYVLLLRVIEIGLRDGYSQIEFGSTTYGYKRLIGCEIVETLLYFRHRSRILTRLLAPFKFIVEPRAKELK